VIGRRSLSYGVRGSASTAAIASAQESKRGVAATLVQTLQPLASLMAAIASPRFAR
jgi:hypothetical protein